MPENFLDPNGLSYIVKKPIDSGTNTYKIKLQIKRLPAELEGMRKRDIPTSPYNEFYATIHFKAGRKIFEDEKDVQITLHPDNQGRNSFKKKKTNTTSIAPQATPLDVIAILIKQGVIKDFTITNYIAEQIYFDGYTLGEGALDYLGLFLDMKFIKTPPDGKKSDYSSIKIIPNEVWYLKIGQSEIRRILGGEGQPKLYSNASKWRIFLQSHAQKITIINRLSELYLNVIKILEGDSTLEYRPTRSSDSTLQGNLFQALGKFNTDELYWVGNTIKINADVPTYFDTEKFSLIASDMIGETDASRIMALNSITLGFDAVIGFLKLHRDVNIMIEGHTDRQGEPAYDNAGLSQQRANTVSQYFNGQGIGLERILSVAGVGSRDCAEKDFPNPNQPTCRKVSFKFVE